MAWTAEIQTTGFELKGYGLHRLRATVSVYIMHIVCILRYLFDYATGNLPTDSLLEYQWCVYKLFSHVWTSLRRPVVPRFSALRKVPPALSSYTVLHALLNVPISPSKKQASWSILAMQRPRALMRLCEADSFMRTLTLALECSLVYANVHATVQTFLRRPKRSSVGTNVCAWTLEGA